MTTDKKFLPEITIYSHNGDLSKEWYIEWWDGNKRVRRRKGIKEHNTVSGRLQAAENLKAEWLEKLSKNIAGTKGTSYHKQYRTIMSYIESKKGAWRLSTKQQIDVRIKKFLEWNNMQEINRDRIEAFLDHLANIGRKKNTVSGYYVNLKTVIGACLGTKLFEGIQLKRESGTPARYFSAGQVKFLSKNLAEKDQELWFAVRFIFYCFIRPAELRLLKVGDVIVEDAKICIPANASKNKKTQYVIIPESFLLDVESNLIGRSPGEYLIGGKFAPIGKNWLKTRHQKLLKEFHFNTENHKLYSWKHTGAVMAVKAGVHIKQLQMQLRHHSLDQVNAYLRQLGVMDLGEFSSKMPKI